MRQGLRHFAFPAAVLAAALGIAAPAALGDQEPRSTIAFVSNRDEPVDPRPAANWEIWLMNGDGTDPRRLTFNTEEGFADFMPSLSPDGKGKIVFDSNRLRVPGEPPNTSYLFLMNRHGDGQVLLTRGSSASWSPVGNVSKDIAFHRSASFTVPPAVGLSRPIRPDPGAPAFDSDIFVVNVRELLEEGAQPRNLTDNGDLFVEDDANWSPDGTKIAYTRHPRHDSHTNSVLAEICVIDASGAGEPVCILGETVNGEEERGPAWSPDGTRFAYMCRKGDPANTGGTIPTFEICVINADGTNERRLTTNNLLDGTPQWSPDGLRILFSRGPNAVSELWLIDADGVCPEEQCPEEQFTDTAGFNIFGNWGEIRVGHGEGPH